MSKLDIREIHVTDPNSQVLAFGTFEDRPGEVGFVCEVEEGGVRKRRVIFFPEDQFLAVGLIHGLMDIMGIKKIYARKDKRCSFEIGEIPERVYED